jgi:hypothetical protein
MGCAGSAGCLIEWQLTHAYSLRAPSPLPASRLPYSSSQGPGSAPSSRVHCLSGTPSARNLANVEPSLTSTRGCWRSPTRSDRLACRRPRKSGCAVRQVSSDPACSGACDPSRCTTLRRGPLAARTSRLAGANRSPEADAQLAVPDARYSLARAHRVARCLPPGSSSCWAICSSPPSKKIIPRRPSTGWQERQMPHRNLSSVLGRQAVSDVQAGSLVA